MNFDVFNVALILAILPAIGLALVRPTLLVYAYLSIIIFFDMPVWGVAAGVEVFNIYERGTGILPVSILNIFLVGLAVFSLVRWPESAPEQHVFNAGKYFLAFNLLFTGHVIVGLMYGVSLPDILSAKGTINVVNLSLFVFILRRAFCTPEDVRHVSRFLIACVLLRGIWGIVRLVFLGGDPANFYANYQNIDVRITFFDINDSLFACMGAALAAWELNWKRHQLKPLVKAVYLTTILVGLTVIVFSYRRSAWLGLMAAGLVIVWMQPPRRRLIALAALGSTATLIFGVIALKRFQHAAPGAGFLESLFPDVFGSAERSGIAYGRFSELFGAFETVKDHLILGVGPWGGWGVGGIHEFMHSGFLHVWLKMGLIGLALFVAMLGAVVFFILRQRRNIQPENRGLFEMALAALLFLFPSLLFGNPIIEFRTMQTLGLAMALPYIAYAASRHSSVGQAMNARTAASGAATPTGLAGTPTGLAGTLLVDTRSRPEFRDQS